MATKITNKLLKEAIADAEAVRETAVANAKLVLEESITPQIRDMIARRLRVEAEMGDEEDEDVETSEPTEKSDAPKAPSFAPKAPAAAPKFGGDVKKEATSEKPFQDAEAVGGKDFPADTSAIGGSDNKEPSADAFDTSDVGHGPEANTDSSTDWYDDWSESDFDLDEVIKELEEDIARLAEEEHGEGEEEGEETEEAPTAPVADTEMKSAKSPVAEEEMGAEEGEEGLEGLEELDLEAILAELEADAEGEQPSPQMGHANGMDKSKVMAAKLAELKKELAQHRSVINTLRERLQEVNLLNSKLLFTNKIFRKEGLANEQKVRIIESFDRATNVREVKLVYAALVENLSTAAKTFNASRKKVVAEGLASKATPSTAPKKEVIVENTVARRLQELAGII